MNNTFFNKDIFGQNQYNQNNIPSNNIPLNNNYPIKIETTNINNIIKLNKGKKIKIYTTIPNSEKYKDNEFNGILEQSPYDYIIISEPQTGIWKIIPIKYINYILFEENINYGNDFFTNNWFLKRTLL